MIIIGENINSSRKKIAEAIAKKDLNFLLEQAKLQSQSGAAFVDVNCALSMGNEKQDMIWLVQNIQQKLSLSISIDSPDPLVIEQTLRIHKGKAFINSITAESEKLKNMLGILEGKDVFVVALTMDDSGMPQTSDDRVSMAVKLVDILKQHSIKQENIFVDPLTKPISSEPEQAKEFLSAVRILKQKGIKTTGGLSNVSYGLPARKILNSVFVLLAKEAGIDAAIIDPIDPLMREVIKNNSVKAVMPDEIYKLAKDALLGDDPYSMNYIKAFRAGKLQI